MRCSNIDYFSEEEYIPDQNDSTMAIPCKSTRPISAHSTCLNSSPFICSLDSIKRASAYLLASCLILALGELIYLCRKVCGHRQILTLLSGICFILAGNCHRLFDDEWARYRLLSPL